MKGKARTLLDALRQMRGIEHKSGPTAASSTYLNKKKVLEKFEQYEFPKDKVLTLYVIALEIDGETMYWQRTGSNYWAGFGPVTFFSDVEPVDMCAIIKKGHRVECYTKEITIKL